MNVPDEPLLCATGFDTALIGWVHPFGQSAVAVYDRAKCIRVLMKRDGMSRDDAEEFFMFNTECAYFGPNTPLFLNACNYKALSAAMGVGNGD